jgi:DNA-binding beta-propeller fold protein YncE
MEPVDDPNERIGDSSAVDFLHNPPLILQKSAGSFLSSPSFAHIKARNDADGGVTTSTEHVRVFVPTGNAVRVAGPDGTFEVSTSALGLSPGSYASAYDPLTATIFVADHGGDINRLVAIDAASPWIVRWASKPGAIRHCHGIAVLPEAGVVFASSQQSNYIVAFRIRDGEQVCPHSALRGALHL